MNRKLKILLPLACLLASAAALGAVLVNRDTIVIIKGIRTWRMLRIVATAPVALSAAVSVASIIRLLKAPDPVPAIPDAPAKKSLTESDRQALYQELKSFKSGKWAGMAAIGGLLDQLDSMDEYQEEMGRLLDQTEYLKEKPAEIVQRVEDCMYVNIKKLLNYMRIIQLKSRETMAAKIRECAEKNADLLKKTDDFVVAVVDYVNGDMVPGEEQKTKDYVDSYMFVVLEAIELPETYLR